MHSGTLRLAVAGVALLGASATLGLRAATAQAAAIARPVSVDVVWPTTGEVERRDGNGLSIAGGVATVDGSDQYGLRSLGVDAERESVTFVYVDAWTLDSQSPPSCAFTFRQVGRPLSQAEANALSVSLATAELDTLKTTHADLVAVGHRTTEGSAVTRQVDRYTFGPADKSTDGLSKTWVFVLDAKAYYINKICVAPDAAALTVIDQLIGLNYRTGVTPPAPVTPPPPQMAPVAAPSVSAVANPAPAAADTEAAPVRRSGWRMPRLRLPHLG